MNYFNCKRKSIMQMSNMLEWIYKVLETSSSYISYDLNISDIKSTQFQKKKKKKKTWVLFRGKKEQLWPHFLLNCPFLGSLRTQYIIHIWRKWTQTVTQYWLKWQYRKYERQNSAYLYIRDLVLSKPFLLAAPCTEVDFSL